MFNGDNNANDDTNMNTTKEEKKGVNSESNHIGGHRGRESHGKLFTIALLVTISVQVWLGTIESFYRIQFCFLLCVYNMVCLLTSEREILEY